jgi:hypothetical protein
MASKRANQQRPIFRQAPREGGQLEAREEIHVINPTRSRDDAWRFLEMNPLEFQEIKGFNQRETESPPRRAQGGLLWKSRRFRVRVPGIHRI